MAQRLHIDSDGRLQGPASITHNSPFPCPNGESGMSVPKGVMGVIMQLPRRWARTNCRISGY